MIKTRGGQAADHRGHSAADTHAHSHAEHGHAHDAHGHAAHKYGEEPAGFLFNLRVCIFNFSFSIFHLIHL